MAELEPRVAVLESEVSELKNEQLRTRARLHDLESDRATLRLLVQETKEMGRNVEKIAARAAERAVELTFRSHGIPDGNTMVELLNGLKQLLVDRSEEQGREHALSTISRWAIGAATLVSSVWWLPELLHRLHH